MIQEVTDVRSNVNDQIANAAHVIGRSKHKQLVFEAICRGKKKVKSVYEISRATGLSEVRVLQAGGELHAARIVQKLRKAYQKDPFYAKHYRKVLTLAANPQKLNSFPTKVTSKQKNTIVKIRFPRIASNAVPITVKDIQSFAIRDRKTSKGSQNSQIPEDKLKKGFKSIIGETGTFKDWGGERNDLFTTKVEVASRRRPTVFAFKGKATKGKLTLDKMGKRADQIHRLFQNEAEVFLVVYQGQIDQIILETMKALAISKALAGQKVYYGVIDGDDTARLIESYADQFK